MRRAKTCTIILHFKFHKQNLDQIAVQIRRPIKQEVRSCFTFIWWQITLFLLWCAAVLYHLWQRHRHSVLSETIMAKVLVRAAFTVPDVNLCTTSYNQQQNCWETVLKYGNYSCRMSPHPHWHNIAWRGLGRESFIPFLKFSKCQKGLLI